MYSSTELSAARQYQGAKITAPSSNTSYAFLSSPPQHKHKPQQAISTWRSPPRSLPRSTSRRRSTISGSPTFQASFVSLTPTPISDSSKTLHLTNYGYTAAFATSPRRGSVSHEQEARLHLVRRVPVSPKRSHAPELPKRSNQRPPSSPFAPPSPTRMRPRAKSTVRIPLPTPPPPPPSRTSKLSKIRSLTTLRTRSPSPEPPFHASTKSVMTTPAITNPKTNGKHAKRSATPVRGSAAFTKYRPMPFIQQMQMIQFLEGGTLDAHIRRHHVHAGQGIAHTGFATGGKEDIAHGYSFTDERGMIWFDEEEEWEFTSLLPRPRPPHRRGIKRLLGMRSEEKGGDEWEDFVEEEELDEDVDPEVLLARGDADLYVHDDDLASFGGALEGPWAKDHSGPSVLELPKSKTDRKSKGSGRMIPSTPTPLPEPEPVLATTGCPRERIVALKQEFLATAFTPPPVRISSPPVQQSRTTSPFRSASRTFFQLHNRAARSVPNPNTPAKSQSFVNLGSSLRGGEVLDATERFSVPPSPTLQWETVEDKSVAHASSLSLASATETLWRTMSPSPSQETRLKSMSPPPAAARRLGLEPSTQVSLQPIGDTTKKPTFKNLRPFRTTKGS